MVFEAINYDYGGMNVSKPIHPPSNKEGEL
jgi:hypothetical protein